MKNFTLQEELVEWLNEEDGEGDFKDFSFWADETKGSFDSEKGAMTDYKIYAKNNNTGEKYVGRGGYYNSDGHHFFSPVEFVLQEKKKKKIEPVFTPVKIEQIIDIIEDFEDRMSDGFGYYCNDREKMLTELASKILQLTTSKGL